MAGTLKKLTVISQRYPAPGEPVFTFVEELVQALADMGVDVTVISPESLTRVLVRGGVHMPRRSVRKTPLGNAIRLEQPRYLSIGAKGGGLGRRSYRSAVRRAARKLDAPDAYYAHFFMSGVAAAECAGDVPVFVGCGESQIRLDLAADVKRTLNKYAGIISVSSKNKSDAHACYGINEGDIIVLPNAVDERVFHPNYDRAGQRKALGLADGDFVVAFVGWFSERKGVKRVEAALRGLPGVKVIYIGYGELVPAGDNIAFSGRVEHDDVPKYLCAADAFVLPTRAEGCCNAIVEAMACGLPVISSIGAFNDDLLSPDNSIRVDPDDISAIRSAVEALKNDPARRAAMRASALAFAEQLSVKRRAERIRAFIESRL